MILKVRSNGLENEFHSLAEATKNGAYSLLITARNAFPMAWTAGFRPTQAWYSVDRGLEKAHQYCGQLGKGHTIAICRQA